MPLGTGNVVQSTVNTAGFIPEVWSDEIIAAYKKNLVAANLFKKMSMKGKKGDVMHFPSPARGSAAVKSASSQVTLIAESGTEKTVTVNQHYEYSRLIEDFAEVQALSSLRRFYTDDAGYALATRIDTSLIQLGRGAQSGTAGSAAYDKAYLAGDGSTLYVDGTNVGTALTDAGLRRAIQRLDDSDVPMDGRFLIVPPSTRNTMMGLARFTEQAFVGDGATIRNGQIGDVYGVKVFVTTNADTATTTTTRIALLAHPEAFVLVDQLGVRVQTQYKQEYLGTLLTADTLYGVGELRDTSAVALAVPA
jgi:N4-gp56 family major capsid protein